jgi:YtkA-like
MKKILSAGMVILLIISACSKKTNINPDNGITGKVKVGESNATGSSIKVTLYQNSTFLTGYNKIYLVLTDSASGTTITNATATISTSMQMMGMPNMICPVEQPVFNRDTSAYIAACAFNMATGNGMGQWNISVNVKNPSNGKQGIASFMVNVNNSTYSMITTATGSDGQTYMITLVQPLKPQVGMNTLELLVDIQNMDMSYSPVNNFKVQFTPEMPAMADMTSTDNQNPVVTANGHYVGKVNFSMTGDWKLDIDLLNGQATIVKDADIEFTF